ncbi:MAG: cytochrome c oxidase subunit II, partial [Ktedonobacterales bacterium]
MPFRSRITRWGLAALGVLVVCALGGWANPPNILDPRGPVALKESDLFWFILIVATVVFVIVMSALLYSIIRFRARPGMPAPRQLHGNNALEIGWTIVPSIILLLVLIFTISTMFSLAQPTGVPTMTVRAVGHQWWWEFQYPDQHLVTADELHVPTNMVVHVELYSNNVIHSFWIPQLTGKTDVIPGHNNTMWFSSNTPGTYRGECAEFCGTQHANMNFEVVVDSPAAYATWLAGQQAPAAKPTS